MSESRYQQSLGDDSTFSVSWELVPGRGAFEEAQAEVVAAAAAAAAGGRVHALTLTDNPGGNPAISAEMLGAEVSRLGIEPVVHFTCKDKNRNQLEGLLYGLERATVRNLLVMSGDYTYTGYQGRSAPVFDLDPTQLLRLISMLNQGLEVPPMRGISRLAPAHFFAGAVVSPFKALEAEQLTQYFKLGKKLKAGAQFIVTQLGYDARKFHEVKLMLEQDGFGHVPLVGSIYVLSLGAARLMNRHGLPGCVVTDQLLADVEAEATSKDKGRAAQLERAAQLYAVLQGMGYKGVHIGGYNMRYEDVAQIIARGEELLPKWRDLVRRFHYPQPNGWYYFQPDLETGLNRAQPKGDLGRRPRKPVSYRAFRLLGKTMFSDHGPLFRPMRVLAKAIDGSPMERHVTRLEHLVKVITNECLHCGDCALQDAAYLCVTSQCPKNERNGPCGGSFQGWCEVYPQKKRCIYVRAYTRLKSYGEQDSLAAYQVPPVNYDLRWTSSWLNFYLGRDHTAKRLGIPPPENREPGA